jgi:hypothetical protein
MHDKIEAVIGNKNLHQANLVMMYNYIDMWTEKITSKLNQQFSIPE